MPRLCLPFCRPSSFTSAGPGMLLECAHQNWQNEFMTGGTWGGSACANMQASTATEKINSDWHTGGDPADGRTTLRDVWAVSGRAARGTAVLGDLFVSGPPHAVGWSWGLVAAGEMNVAPPFCTSAPKQKLFLEALCVSLGISILACVDNLQVSSQVNGIWARGSDKLHNASVDAIRWMLHCLRVTCGLKTWPLFPHFFLHRGRDQNRHADALCNQAIDQQKGGWWWKQHKLVQGDKILITSDGACRGQGQSMLRPASEVLSSCACIVWVCRDLAPPCAVACMSSFCHNKNSVCMEFDGAVLGLQLVCAWLRHVSVRNVEDDCLCC